MGKMYVLSHGTQNMPFAYAYNICADKLFG